MKQLRQQVPILPVLEAAQVALAVARVVPVARARSVRSNAVRSAVFALKKIRLLITKTPGLCATLLLSVVKSYLAEFPVIAPNISVKLLKLLNGLGIWPYCHLQQATRFRNT
jgi:hypothetical protein